MNTSRIRAIVWGLALVVMAGLAGMKPGTASAESAKQIVYPTGQYPQDVDNVQAAVNGGGTVLLKATHIDGEPMAFNFGPAEAGSGRVSPSIDVTILGENTGARMTTIQGGSAPFRSMSSVEITIRGIHFEGPFAAAFFLSESSGAEFSFNRITDVVGIPDLFGPGIDKGQAVWATNPDPDLIHGELIITDNYIEGVEAEVGFGLALFSFGAETHIERNEIRDTNLSGMLIGINTRDVWIEQNLIVPGPASPSALFSIGTGIAAQEPLGARYYISKNIVEIENPEADGIYIAGTNEFGAVANESVIEKNHVIMHHSRHSAIGLYGNVNHTLVSQNRIEGSAATALIIDEILSPGHIAEANRFFQNNINHFEAQVADVLLGVNSIATEFNGFCGTLIDHGLDNDIWCLGEGMPPNSTALSRQEERQAILALTSSLPLQGFQSDSIHHP